MDNILLILKGILIGIGKIIPGVSGGMLAISLGVYENAIYAFNNLLKNFKENFKYILLLTIGVLFSIIFMSSVILFFLDKFYFSTMLLFTGLILGGINDIKKEIKRKNNYIILFVFLSVIVLGLIYSNLNLNLQHNFIYYIFMGILEAITMILPGISGTAVLMMFGCYNTVITAFSNFTNFYISTRNFLILLPFAIGIAIGAIFTLKFVNILFKKYKNITYNVIYGFSLSTILFILVNCLKSSYSLIDLLIGLALFWLGYIAIKKINSLN